MRGVVAEQKNTIDSLELFFEAIAVVTYFEKYSLLGVILAIIEKIRNSPSDILPIVR